MGAGGWIAIGVIVVVAGWAIVVYNGRSYVEIPMTLQRGYALNRPTTSR